MPAHAGQLLCPADFEAPGVPRMDNIFSTFDLYHGDYDYYERIAVAVERLAIAVGLLIRLRADSAMHGTSAREENPNAHVLLGHLQNSIILLALDVFDPRSLIRHSIFVDDNNILLPRHRENAFFKVNQLPADFQLDQSNLPQYPHQLPSRKVMLCSSR